MIKLVTIYDLRHMEKLSEFADGFIGANDQFATRVERSFSVLELLDLIKEAHRLNKKIYISINQMMHNDQIASFKEFIQTLETANPTGYIVGDIGVVYLLRELKIEAKGVYNPETLLTNVFDFNFNQTLGVHGAFLAKEITLEDILAITKQKKLHAFMYVHGYLNMFYSKRQLISSYFENLDQNNPYHDKRNLKIKEEKRPDLVYPILEDNGGTHVFRDKVFSTLNHMNRLKEHIDYAVFDMVLHDDSYTYDVLKRYVEVLEGKEPLTSDIEQKYGETWDDGFLYKKTVYKPKKVTR